MTPARRIFRPATSSDVLTTYELLYNSGLVSFPIVQDSRAKVESALAAVNNSYFGVEPFPTPEEKLVAYLYFLIKAHAFTDGNKRTAVLVFSTFCVLNGLEPDKNKLPLDALAIYIEQLKDADVHHVITVIAAALFGFDFLKK